MTSEDSTDRPEQRGEATTEEANGAFTVTFSSPAAAAAEHQTRPPKATVTAAMRAPFDQSLHTDTDAQPSARPV